MYPVGASSVCCAVCNAVTAVPPPVTCIYTDLDPSGNIVKTLLQTTRGICRCYTPVLLILIWGSAAGRGYASSLRKVVTSIGNEEDVASKTAYGRVSQKKNCIEERLK
ncbi:hypothetical protein YC2023_059892 [Brassica napus]